MKTFAAAILGLIACVETSTASTMIRDEVPAKKRYFRDIWGAYHSVSVSVPGRVYLQWFYPYLSAAVAALSTDSTSNGLPVLGDPSPSIDPESVIGSTPSTPTGAGFSTVQYETPVIPKPVAATNVPDGGSTLILFSGALACLWWFQRRGGLATKIG